MSKFSILVSLYFNAVCFVTFSLTIVIYLKFDQSCDFASFFATVNRLQSGAV